MQIEMKVLREYLMHYIALPWVGVTHLAVP